MKAEWKGRSEFAEFAEAIGVNTSQVMAVMSTGEVMWTEDRGAGDSVYLATWGRDDDGVVKVWRQTRISSVEEWMDGFHRLLESMEGEEP